MQVVVQREQAWKRTWMPNKACRSAIYQLHFPKYHDTLCADMGVDHRRKGWNVLAELFAPQTARDYAALFDDGAAKFKNAAEERRAPLHPQDLLTMLFVMLAVVYYCYYYCGAGAF